MGGRASSDYRLLVRALHPLLVALFASTACVGAGPSPSIELRDGASITIAENTYFDLEELESRDGYGATLVDPEGINWFVSVAHAEASEFTDLGFGEFGSIHGTGYFGEGFDDCEVYLPLGEDAFVRLARARDGVNCPQSIDEIDQWLPRVEPTDTVLRAFGDVVGEFDGITAYSNGTFNTVSKKYSTVGMMWQSTEYVNRYFYQKLAHKNLIHTGHAKDYYGTAASKDLVAYPNGGMKPPSVGDMLVSKGNGAIGNYGHIAIVREVGKDYVHVIHQNWTNTNGDNLEKLPMNVAGGTYTVSSFAPKYPVAGWLRRAPACMPMIYAVTPTAAKLNQSTQFIAAGRCLSLKTTAAWIADCENLVVDKRTDTMLVFTCSPSHSTGVKAGEVEHDVDGTLLMSFEVAVQ